MPRLRPYQQRAVEATRQAINDRPLVCVAPGGGKTHIASDIIRRAVKRGRKVLFLVHRRELAEQAHARLAAFGVESGTILAGTKEDRRLPVQVASVQSLVRREKPPADLVIVDECHHATSATWLRILAHYADAYLIGLTATPYRLDGTGLGAIFGTIIEPITPRQLVEEGILVAPRIFSHPTGHDVAKGVKKSHGDYAIGALGERMSQAHLLGSVVDHWEKHSCHGRRTVAFAVNVAHSELVCEAFQDRGYKAAHLDGTTPRAERSMVLAMLERGEIDVLSNCMIVSEGWDLPALEVAILARPTASLSLHCQQVGRVMRAAPDKDGALVLDHAGNYLEHGNPLDQSGFDLSNAPKREATEAGPKTCPECFAICERDDESCPECGHVFKSERELEQVDGSLVEYTESKQEFQRSVYLAFVQQANEYRYSLGWARYRYKERIGKWPKGKALKDIEHEHYKCYIHDPQEKEYGPRKVVRCRLCFRELGLARV